MEAVRETSIAPYNCWIEGKNHISNGKCLHVECRVLSMLNGKTLEEIMAHFQEISDREANKRGIPKTQVTHEYIQEIVDSLEIFRHFQS